MRWGVKKYENLIFEWGIFHHVGLHTYTAIVIVSTDHQDNIYESNGCLLTQSNWHISDQFDRHNRIGLPVDIGERDWERIVAERSFLIIITSLSEDLEPADCQDCQDILTICASTSFWSKWYLTQQPIVNIYTLTICWTSRMAGIHSDDLIRVIIIKETRPSVLGM